MVGFLVLGALCSCKDNNIVLESLNFLFSGEVDILFFVSPWFLVEVQLNEF